MRRLAPIAILAVAVAVAGCGLAASDTPEPPPKPGSISYQLSCQAPVVDEVKTWVTYTVTPSANPVSPGESVRFEVDAPPAAVEGLVDTTFVSSRVSYPLPTGMDVESVSMHPGSTRDVDRATARLQGGAIVVEQQGDFPLDGSKRALPKLVIAGTVTAGAGGAVQLSTPTEVVGTAHAGVFGDQTSTCHVIDPGPIWTSQVE